MIRSMMSGSASVGLAIFASGCMTAAQTADVAKTVQAAQAPQLAVQTPQAPPPPPTPKIVTPGDCASLTNLAIKGGAVTAASMVTLPASARAPTTPAPTGTGKTEPPKALSYCRVQVTLKPDPGSNIKVEVWLPEKADWNGKFLGTGNGGAAGSIVTAALQAGVNRGYATANTDMGSSGGKGGLNFGFGIGRPDLQRDFNYRATDGMTLEGKAVTEAFYGAKPKFSYFQGCSSGGSQGWEQIQHLPTAYNGVIIGAAANQRPNLHMARIWNEWNNLSSPEATVSKAKMQMITNLAISQCDRIDGAKDGLISLPQECRVDLKPILCKPTGAGRNAAIVDAPDCLTPRQAETVKAIWQGATNPRTKDRIYWGFEPGSESAIDLHWDAKIGPEGKVIVSDNMINWSPQYQAAHPDGVGFDFDKDVARAGEDLVDANWSEDRLDAFQKAGGKVIIYHGWADGLVPAAGSVAYYEAIAKANGGLDKINNFARLFMIPGMGHCRGGIGPDQFDMLDALEYWVELDYAPDTIPASRPARNGLPAITRPLCPYPSIEKYTGDGDINDTANFVCGKSGAADDWSGH